MSETTTAPSAQVKTPIQVCQFFSFKTSTYEEDILKEGKPIFKKGKKVTTTKTKISVLLVRKGDKLSLPGLKNLDDLDPRILLKNNFTQKLGITIDGKLGKYNDEDYVSEIFFLKGEVDAFTLNAVKKIKSSYVDLESVNFENLQPISKRAIEDYLKKYKN